MLRFIAFCLGALVVASAAVPPAAAQPSPDWIRCTNNPKIFTPDVAIASGNAILQSGRETTASRAGAYYNRGNAYSDKKDYDRAIADYSEAIRLDPRADDAYNNRGRAYFAKKDTDRAIADYNEAIRLNPRAEAYYNRGNAYFGKKDYDRAIADYRGLAFEVLGRRQEAVADFRRAQSMDPNHQGSRDALKRLGSAALDKAPPPVA